MEIPRGLTFFSGKNSNFKRFSVKLNVFQIPLPEPGVYKLSFDNTHAKIWSKNVNFFVKVIE